MLRLDPPLLTDPLNIYELVVWVYVCEEIHARQGTCIEFRGQLQEYILSIIWAPVTESRSSGFTGGTFLGYGILYFKL